MVICVLDVMVNTVNVLRLLTVLEPRKTRHKMLGFRWMKPAPLSPSGAIALWTKQQDNRFRRRFPRRKKGWWGGKKGNKNKTETSPAHATFLLNFALYQLDMLLYCWLWILSVSNRHDCCHHYHCQYTIIAGSQASGFNLYIFLSCFFCFHFLVYSCALSCWH